MTCYVCGSKERTQYDLYLDTEHNGKSDFQKSEITQCDECGNVYLTKEQLHLNELYRRQFISGLECPKCIYVDFPDNESSLGMLGISTNFEGKETGSMLLKLSSLSDDTKKAIRWNSMKYEWEESTLTNKFVKERLIELGKIK